MTGDKKDPTIDENLARIRELVESVKKPESPESQAGADSGDTSHQGEQGEQAGAKQTGATQQAQEQQAQGQQAPKSPPIPDEGTAHNLARKGVLDSASRTPLTDYVSEKMPHYLDAEGKQAPASPDTHVQSLPTADNGFNEPFAKATVNPIDGDEKPAPFVTGVSTQQIKPRADADKDDEIPKTVLDTLLQSGEKGKVHIRSGVNAPAFTSPHNMQLSINRDNRRALEDPERRSESQKSGNPFANMQTQKENSQQGAPHQDKGQNTAPLVLTDVLTLDDVVSEPPQADTPPQPPKTPTTVSDKSVPDESAPDESVPDESVPDESVPDESVPDESVLIRIRSAMEHLKQVQIEKEPFDTAVRDMVETEVRPMVKKWVNDNIADVVERQVDTEIQKILGKI